MTPYYSILCLNRPENHVYFIITCFSSKNIHEFLFKNILAYKKGSVLIFSTLNILLV